jgi:hypothetical protein
MFTHVFRPVVSAIEEAFNMNRKSCQSLLPRADKMTYKYINTYRTDEFMKEYGPWTFLSC